MSVAFEALWQQMENKNKNKNIQYICIQKPRIKLSSQWIIAAPESMLFIIKTFQCHNYSNEITLQQIK